MRSSAPGWRPIPLAYTSRCRECRRKLPRGTVAYWLKGSGVKCYPRCPS
jgi:hypothetical protein